MNPNWHLRSSHYHIIIYALVYALGFIYFSREFRRSMWLLLFIIMEAIFVISAQANEQAMPKS